MELAVGQKVWLSTRHLPIRAGARKLSTLWTGPYDVIEVVAPHAYRLQLPEAWNIHPVFHISQLKEAIGNVMKEEAI